MTKALFKGYDTNDHSNLWVTDGTSAGTSELTVAGAYSSGLNPLDITAFGSKALFEGHDASSHVGLWVTDGTAAGTSELTVAGAFSGGLFSGFTQLHDVGPESPSSGARRCSRASTRAIISAFGLQTGPLQGRAS